MDEKLIGRLSAAMEAVWARIAAAIPEYGPVRRPAQLIKLLEAFRILLELRRLEQGRPTVIYRHGLDEATLARLLAAGKLPVVVTLDEATLTALIGICGPMST